MVFHDLEWPLRSYFILWKVFIMLKFFKRLCVKQKIYHRISWFWNFNMPCMTFHDLLFYGKFASSHSYNYFYQNRFINERARKKKLKLRNPQFWKIYSYTSFISLIFYAIDLCRIYGYKQKWQVKKIKYIWWTSQ